MVEDYRIKFHTGRAESTGQYMVNRRGNTKAITKYVERYETPMGEFLPEIWREEAKEEIKAAGEMELLEQVKEHCRNHCAWLKKENELEDYAINCVCNRAYRAWKDFEYEETIIWM